MPAIKTGTAGIVVRVGWDKTVKLVSPKRESCSSYVMKHIINLSLETGTVPRQLKGGSSPITAQKL